MINEKPTISIFSKELQQNQIHYPFHGNSSSKNVFIPDLLPMTTMSGNWDSLGFYSFPSNNTTDCFNTDNSVNMDTILTLKDINNKQLIIGCEIKTPDSTGNGFIWCYGQFNNSYSYYGLAINSSEQLVFYLRSIGGADTNTIITPLNSLNINSDKSFIVCSIVGLTDTLVKIDIYTRNKNDSSYILSTANVDILGSGTSVPGRNDNAYHAGLTIGARPISGWNSTIKSDSTSYSARFSSSGKIGNFFAEKFESYDENRLIQIGNLLYNKPTELPI